MAKRVLLALLACLGWAGAAHASCGGRDMLADLERRDAAAHARLMAEGEAVPNGQSRFWRVTPPGGGAHSFLFGTYHDTEAARTVPQPVLDRLDGASRLLVELTREEIERMEARIALDPAFSLGGDVTRSLAERLTREERRAAEAALAARGLNLETASLLKPWMLFSLVGIPACQLRALGQGAEVLDQTLIERARRRGTPVEGLETYEAALGVFADIDPDAAIELARDMLRLADREEDIRRTMLNLYADGRTGAIKAFGEWLTAETAGRRAEEAQRLADAFEGAVLDSRNLAWLATLEPALRGGGIFVAFGALHLPGETGIVELLRARGFTVEPEPEDG